MSHLLHFISLKITGRIGGGHGGYWRFVSGCAWATELNSNSFGVSVASPSTTDLERNFPGPQQLEIKNDCWGKDKSDNGIEQLLQAGNENTDKFSCHVRLNLYKTKNLIRGFQFCYNAAGRWGTKWDWHCFRFQGTWLDWRRKNYLNLC